MTIKRLVRLVTVTLREDQQEFNIQRSPIEKKRRGGGEKEKEKEEEEEEEGRSHWCLFFFAAEG